MKLGEKIKEKVNLADALLKSYYANVRLDNYDADGVLISLEVSVKTLPRYIYVVCTPIPKWEETEEYRLAVEEYNHKLELYNTFECNFTRYMLYDKRADETTFKLWQSVREWVNTPTDADIKADNKVCFIEWLEHHWGAWMASVLDCTYKYMNVTSLVLDSWKEFGEED